MALLIRKPLIAASLALSTLALVGFLWQKRRHEFCEDNKLADTILGDSEVEVNSNLKLIENKFVNLAGNESHNYQPSDIALVNSTDKHCDTKSVSFNCTNSEPSTMTEKDCPDANDSSVVPNLEKALKDPLCTSTQSPACSPTKSESSVSQVSCSEAWSDLIEKDEELLGTKFNEDLSYEIELSLEDRARQDSGVASPCPQTLSQECFDQVKLRKDSGGEDAGLGGSEQGDNGSDSGQGSDVYCEDAQLLAYHFQMPDYLCGKLIGAKGEYINKLKSDTNCNIIVRETTDISPKKRNRLKTWARRSDSIMNLCIIEGTRNNIDKCLDIIRERFARHSEVTLEQINKPENNILSVYNGSMYLNLVEGIMHDVILSSIVTGAHVFVQQPGHPTFSALERLNSCINKTYSQLTCPQVAKPIQPNTICVALSQGGWYRCQVMTFDEESDSCEVKFVDYGGYETVSTSDLRQIRTDFLSLPFQAIECYLANLILPEEDTSSASVLDELAFGQVLQARMIGCDENEVSMIHLYRVSSGQTVMINRELVDRGTAQWIAATIIPRDHSGTPAQF